MIKNIWIEESAISWSLLAATYMIIVGYLKHMRHNCYPLDELPQLNSTWNPDWSISFLLYS